MNRQLRGRAGRQGDPGFFAILHLAGRRPQCVCSHRNVLPNDGPYGLQRGEMLEHNISSKSVERAEESGRKCFGIRKRLLEYDDVMNSQREGHLHERSRRRNALCGAGNIESISMNMF